MDELSAALPTVVKGAFVGGKDSQGRDGKCQNSADLCLFFLFSFFFHSTSMCPGVLIVRIKPAPAQNTLVLPSSAGTDRKRKPRPPRSWLISGSTIARISRPVTHFHLPLQTRAPGRSVQYVVRTNQGSLRERTPLSIYQDGSWPFIPILAQTNSFVPSVRKKKVWNIAP